MTNLTNKLFLPVFMLLLSISPALAHNDTFFNSPHRLELKPASFAEPGYQLAKSYWLGGADLDLNFKGEDDKTRCNSMGYFQEACQGNKSPLLKCPYNSAYVKCTCDTSIYRYSALNCPPGSYPDEDVCDDYSKGCVCENNKIWSAEDNSCVGCLSDSDCADGKECNNRECVNIDLCAGVNCTGGQSCNSETGACECPSGEVFYNNRCEAPSCTNKEIQCSGSTPVCAANGQCVECVSASDCGANEICSGNTCQTVDRCKDVSCSGGKSCNPNNGQCECPSDKPYESGGVCEAPNCTNGGVTCPSGQTCNSTSKLCEEAGAPILYSDMTTSRDLISGKTPIGVVFDESRRLAVYLRESRNVEWQASRVMGKDVSLIDIPGLTNISNETSAKNDFNGKSNTDIIYNYIKNHSNRDAWSFYYNINSYYVTSADSGKWYVPALGELLLLQKNKDAVNLTLGKIQGSHLLETDPGAVMYERYWSSDEYSQDHAWYITMPSGEVGHSWKYASSVVFRLIIKY